jgi:hypothetical protein
VGRVRIVAKTGNNPGLGGSSLCGARKTGFSATPGAWWQSSSAMVSLSFSAIDCRNRARRRQQLSRETPFIQRVTTSNASRCRVHRHQNREANPMWRGVETRRYGRCFCTWVDAKRAATPFTKAMVAGRGLGCRADRGGARFRTMRPSRRWATPGRLSIDKQYLPRGII